MNGVAVGWSLHPNVVVQARRAVDVGGARHWWPTGDEWRRRWALHPPVRRGEAEEGLAARRSVLGDA